MSSSVYVSGLPGIGKTTVCNYLVDMRPDRYVRLSFGELLRDVAVPQASVESFRANSSANVDRAAIEAATVAGAERIRNEASRIVLVDSHAVTPVAEGIRATPDTADRVTQFGYSVIVHLDASTAETRVVENGGSEGRRAMTAAEVASAEVMQLSIVTHYASLCDCPLYVVSARGSTAEIAGRAEDAIAAGLAWY